MSIPTIDVGREFYHRLANRDESQGDGQHNAIQFRKQFLAHLDSKAIWDAAPECRVRLDFAHVTIIAPSFANEAFAYFTRYDAKPQQIFEVIQFLNISPVKRQIIEVELNSGYYEVST